MKTNLLTTAAAIAALVLTSTPAFAQQTVGPVGPGADAANSNSQSGASSTNANTNFNGGNGPITIGPTTVGPQTATSDSDARSQSLSTAITRSEGGSATSDSHSQGGNAAATNGPVSATANPTASNAGNAQNITFNSTVPQNTKARIETTPQVYAPALSTTLTETCMGSTSGGISVMGFGGTLGTTWNDGQCVRRLNAREMAQTLGDRAAARALMCQDKDVAAAYLAVGQDCRQKYEVAVVVPPPPPISPVVINVPPAPAPIVQMAPIPNPQVIYRDRPAPHRARPKNVPACEVDQHYACPKAHD